MDLKVENFQTQKRFRVKMPTWMTKKKTKSKVDKSGSFDTPTLNLVESDGIPPPGKPSQENLNEEKQPADCPVHCKVHPECDELNLGFIKPSTTHENKSTSGLRRLFTIKHRKRSMKLYSKTTRCKTDNMFVLENSSDEIVKSCENDDKTTSLLMSSDEDDSPDSMIFETNKKPILEQTLNRISEDEFEHAVLLRNSSNRKNKSSEDFFLKCVVKGNREKQPKPPRCLKTNDNMSRELYLLVDKDVTNSESEIDKSRIEGKKRESTSTQLSNSHQATEDDQIKKISSDVFLKSVAGVKTISKKKSIYSTHNVHCSAQLEPPEEMRNENFNAASCDFPYYDSIEEIADENTLEKRWSVSNYDSNDAKSDALAEEKVPQNHGQVNHECKKQEARSRLDDSDSRTRKQIQNIINANRDIVSVDTERDFCYSGLSSDDYETMMLKYNICESDDSLSVEDAALAESEDFSSIMDSTLPEYDIDIEEAPLLAEYKTSLYVEDAVLSKTSLNVEDAVLSNVEAALISDDKKELSVKQRDENSATTQQVQEVCYSNAFINGDRKTETLVDKEVNETENFNGNSEPSIAMINGIPSVSPFHEITLSETREDSIEFYAPINVRSIVFLKVRASLIRHQSIKLTKMMP